MSERTVDRIVAHAYPWDVLGDPHFVDRARALGVAEISLAASYHSTRAATPLHPAHKVVDLPGGGAIAVDLPLFSRSTTGILSVRTSAPGAQVFVDRARIGVAPVETHVPGGTHAIRVTHPDFSDLDTTTVVPAGGRKDLDLTLGGPSILSRWWFWGGVGVAVAAGVAIGIAATTERSPDTGTIAPGQLPAPGAAAFRF